MRMKMRVKQIAIGSYSVMKYDTTKCICTYIHGYIRMYAHNSIISHIA